MSSSDYIDEVVRLTTLRHQFDRQLVHIRSTPFNGCSCGTRNIYQTEKTCDLCGPFLTALHRARTQLDRLIAAEMRRSGFNPEASADEFIDKKMGAFSNV